MFLGTFGLQPNLVQTGRQPPTHPPTRAPPTRAPPTHPPTHPPGRQERFWAHSGFSPIWSEQPESQNRIFLGTFGLQPNLVQTGRHPATHPPTRAPPTRPPTHPGATHPPTHPPGRHECFWAHSGFSPIWSEQPECQKRIFLGTFGLQPNLVRTARMQKTKVFGHIPAAGQFGPNRAPPTHRPSHPGATHPTTNPPTRAPRRFLGTFRLQPNLVRTAGKPKPNVFGHIRASAQFGPNRAPPTHPPTQPGATQPGATHPPTRAPRMFLGTFRLQPNLVRTARMPKTNLFGHIRASAQFGLNSRNAEKECFWAHSGFRPIWSEVGATHPATHPPGRHPPTHPPTRAPRMFLGTFRLQPNLVRTAGMPKANIFGPVRASAQFGPNSRNAKNESFWAHSGFWPLWSEQPECRK